MKNFTALLLSWYQENKRDLPWRNTREPYKIWLSEVILQQTRIDQGLPYYMRFLEAFPAIGDLARADEQQILKLWQGLGYYSRARNLHEAARTIATDFSGIFPNDYTSIRKLKGVGDYTAAAIASISFGLPYAVVDGNVIRFLSRLFGITGPVDNEKAKREIATIAEMYMDKSQPGDFNQAMMEFGATICKPVNPGCRTCVFSESCFANRHAKVESIPARKAKPPKKVRHLSFFLITYPQGMNTMILLNKRSGKDIWKNLYDFPSFESEYSLTPEMLYEKSELFRKINQLGAECLGVSRPVRHLLTHQELTATFYRYHLSEPVHLPYHATDIKKLKDFPLPRLIDRYLSEADLF